MPGAGAFFQQHEGRGRRFVDDLVGQRIGSSTAEFGNGSARDRKIMDLAVRDDDQPFSGDLVGRRTEQVAT